MPEEPVLRPATTDEIAETLAFGLRYEGRKRVHHADGIMARITAERLVPGMMSRWEAASFDHGVGMIARSIVSVRGEESTSAMSSVEAGSPSRPSVESPWGSRSMTSAFTPWCRAAEARPRVTDVLPTPPFREHTLTMNPPAVYRPGQAPRCRDER